MIPAENSSPKCCRCSLPPPRLKNLQWGKWECCETFSFSLLLQPVPKSPHPHPAKGTGGSAEAATDSHPPCPPPLTFSSRAGASVLLMCSTAFKTPAGQTEAQMGRGPCGPPQGQPLAQPPTEEAQGKPGGYTPKAGPPPPASGQGGSLCAPLLP